MKMKLDDVLTYKDSQISMRYGTGVVTSITPDEYTILWSGRGVTRYRRAILDDKLDQIFERVDKRAGLPKERHLNLGSSKAGVAFNENYDRAKVEMLCEKLKSSGARKAKDVADGLAAELFTKKLALRGAAKAVLLQLAELCNARSAARDEAQNISKELFFGYVLQKSDFKEIEIEK
ncbi:MAG: hypothetical protein ACLGJB_09365 [Blastocatellia bacterium]